jgi:hypothetical protein
MRGISPDRGLNPALRCRGRTVHQRKVSFVHTPLLELSLQQLKRFIILGDQDQARGVLVEPMDDSRPQFAADPANVGRVGEGRVDKSAMVVPRRGMDNHTGGLVDHHHLGVLEDDLEGDWLGSEI